jgi:HlyD family secretion protein
LSASADVVVGEKQNVLTVPLQAVFEEHGKQVVYVKEAGMFNAREVRLGMTSHIGGEVLSGLRAGEEVALQHPQPPRQ